VPHRCQVLHALAVLIAVTAIASAQEGPARLRQLLDHALGQTSQRVIYDGTYRRIPYPDGDVPPDRGVCTDVVIRAYRSIGVDLQRLVHEDMRQHFAVYPKRWSLTRPDPNIDHRRVPNLQTFLGRQGAQLPIDSSPSTYRAGDLVTWMLPGNLPHIGMVTDRRSTDGDRPLIVHNIGRGPQLEDMLFAYRITGHYRYAVE
jgi:uncharacterized protein